MLENYAKANNTLKPKLYIDATQAVEYDTVDVGTLLCDGMTFGARKIGAVPGVALLFVKHGVKLEKLIHGGGQEGGIKSGTENIALIAAFYKVLQNAVDKKSKTESVRRLNQIRSYTIERLQNELGDRVEVLGDTKVKYESENKQTFPYFKHASPHILLIYVKGLLGEEMLLRLDARGIAVSTASACSILEGSGSNFLKSLGREKDAKETIRISFGKETAKADIDYFVMALKGIMDKYQK
jgi:cysteine desulfurase